jgi:LmbE family N-acetylglucosaminyl deacetylase
MPIRTRVAWRLSRGHAAAVHAEAVRARVVFLSPHNDDETLFGAFTLLRERPHVIVCLKSVVQDVRGYGITAQRRERETAAALRVLGIPSWTQWEIPDAQPDWELLESRLKALRAEKVYAPAFEEEGHAHHNVIAQIAARVFPADDLTAYMTYTHDGRSESSNLVPFESEWIALKLRALLCYKSQILEPSTRDHFLYPQYEYYA